MGRQSPLRTAHQLHHRCEPIGRWRVRRLKSGIRKQSHQQFGNCSLNIKIMKALRIAIIIGSTRPGRNGEAVAKWVHEIAKQRTDAEFELVEIKDFNLPLLDEPMPPIMGQYSKPHTKTWAAKIGSFDGYVFVTPEYNHGISGALKNAIDFLFAEWNDKAAGFVCYGGARGKENPIHSMWLVTTVFPSFSSHAMGSLVYSYFAEASVFHSLIATEPL